MCLLRCRPAQWRLPRVTNATFFQRAQFEPGVLLVYEPAFLFVLPTYEQTAVKRKIRYPTRAANDGKLLQVGCGAAAVLLAAKSWRIT